MKLTCENGLVIRLPFKVRNYKKCRAVEKRAVISMKPSTPKINPFDKKILKLCDEGHFDQLKCFTTTNQN